MTIVGAKGFISTQASSARCLTPWARPMPRLPMSRMLRRLRLLNNRADIVQAQEEEDVQSQPLLAPPVRRIRTFHCGVGGFTCFFKSRQNDAKS
jgi:hypothetical protein